MFTIIKLDNGKVVAESYHPQEYVSTDKTVAIKQRFYNTRYHISEFDHITAHHTALKNELCIYTLDDSKIEQYKAQLKDYYAIKYKSEIVSLQYKLKQLES